MGIGFHVFQHGHAPLNGKGRPSQHRLTETAFFMKLQRFNFSHPPGTSKELIKRILFFYSTSFRQVKRKLLYQEKDDSPVRESPIKKAPFGALIAFASGLLLVAFAALGRAGGLRLVTVDAELVGGGLVEFDLGGGAFAVAHLAVAGGMGLVVESYVAVLRIHGY
jgi:hypothetical protein